MDGDDVILNQKKIEWRLSSYKQALRCIVRVKPNPIPMEPSPKIPTAPFICFGFGASSNVGAQKMEGNHTNRVYLSTSCHMHAIETIIHLFVKTLSLVKSYRRFKSRDSSSAKLSTSRFCKDRIKRHPFPVFPIVRRIEVVY